ncbi:MAG: cytochrome [Phenylobacterium sp.]|uniref:cytochrome P450 n=1 Tax=Phenylobacterium sp. TaxID=1871053 RepID=UPI00261FF963|nr:cytochrome P450 [Phenylobacterium sp.]MDB5434889.1 cytochrome [Phenylobacterium sp.]MDB5498850.1 cytochrome [Phenylobacterium sp.]
MGVMTAADHRIPKAVADVLALPAAYADGRIHEAYRWLRANEPLGVADIEGVDPFWVVTRHADILEISRQNDLFHNGDRSPTIVSQAADRQVREMMGGSPHLLRTLIHMDAPDHPKYRALTQGWFMPQNLRRLEDQIRVIAKAAAEKMAAAGGRCEFVQEVALHYPLHVIMSILGVPPEDEPRMLKLTQELFGAADPELARDADTPPAERKFDMSVVVDFSNYFRALSDARRANPTDDLASLIANSQVDGQPISDLEAMSYYIIVATAGHDTTSSSTAGALWALAENPGEFAKVKADLSLIPSLVDESIRWTTPVKTFMRTATADVTFAGRDLKKGDWLMLCYASGNRDEAVFDDADHFHVDRKPNRHLAFGYGAHLCLGQHLAKMEMRILWEELVPRLSDLALDGVPAMSEATFVNGPKRLPIRFKMD